jgi:2-dehydropantoate 2-reductase
MTRVAIMGAGAMGCVFGACLAESGCDTVLIDVRVDVVRAIEDTGVTVLREGDERRVSVRASTDPAAVGRADVVLFFVKSFHTEEAAEAARPMVDDATVVATLQNGMGNGDILARRYDPSRVVVGVTAESGTTLGPGVVDHPGRAVTHVGPFDGKSLEASETLAGALSASGFDVHATASVGTEIWKKLAVGASTLPAPALLGMNCGELMRGAEMRDLVDDTAREVVSVARALGHDVDPDERIAYIHELLAAVPAAKGSMVQDIEAGRPTEIDFINGAVVRAGDEAGVAVPVNRALVALVKGWDMMRAAS